MRKAFQKTTLDTRLHLNVNSPFSALICGVQGSGKSHSALVMLEGCLSVERRICTLPKPLAGLCSHCDRGSVNYSCQSTYLRLPATRAQLGAKLTSSVPVTVLVSPTCLRTMRKIYEPLTGVKVMPFYLSTLNLLLSRMLTLMGFDDSVIMPLYLPRAMTIIRPMSADRVNYNGKLLVIIPLNPAQECSYKMRIEMSDSYLTNQKSVNVFSYFKPGHLVIVDLHDPFTNSSLVIALFEIIVGLFVHEQRMETGMIDSLRRSAQVNSDPCSARFTDSMTSLISTRGVCSALDVECHR
ncbi:hypothetical protein PSTT_07093 [Puccinia striiformis]|uniref:Uncharacterized protein n=1 Tax=Puccinia striiformis TaxID=27350 RepID=A0A2S4VHH7_9BASI|nr:hypothetical protein PSTT_07093 [Puccinia striiformis]